MTTTAADTLDLPFQLGEPRTHAGITLTPLFPTRNPICDYVSLDAGLAGGLEITEVGRDGVVNRVAVRNPLPRPVLLYDGEELVGAKQNRVVNRSVLVTGESRLVIPVACVESGRWERRSRRFDLGGHVAGPELRRRKALSLQASGERAVQHEVWAAVDDRLARNAVASPTRAQRDGFAARRPQIGDLLANFALEPGQCGMVAAIAGRGWCVDAVSRPDVFAPLFPRLLAGYAYELAEVAGKATPAGAALSALAAAGVRRLVTPGLGDDLQLEAANLAGTGLRVGGEVVQISAYGWPSGL
jgi:hypothetical protein